MPVIKLRGLPWSCTVDDIGRFMQGINILSKANSAANSDTAQKHNNINMHNSGKNVKGEDSGNGNAEDFTSDNVEANGEDGNEKGEGSAALLAIYLMTNSDGRPSGEAFIEVESESDLEAAIKKNNGLMGQRYIEGKTCLNT